MNLKVLIGSGDKIGLFMLPFLAAGLALNIIYPGAFTVGGPSTGLLIISVIILVPGLVIWAWSVILILTRVPQNKLITSGPYAFVRHPLYTGVALLVLPWLGFLLNTWLGLFLGIVLYIASRVFSPAEEQILSQTFGADWNNYCSRLKLPWL